MQRWNKSAGSKRRYVLAVLFGGVALTIPALALAEKHDPLLTGVQWTVIGVLGVVVLLMVALMACAKFFRAPGGEVQPHAFGLPPGTVRAILAMSLMITFIFMSLQFVVGGLPKGVDAQLADKVFIACSTALATVVGFYFGSGGAKQAMQEVSKALRQQAGTVGSESFSASAEAAAKGAEPAANRAKNAHAKMIAKLDAARKKSDPRVGMLEIDVTEAKKASAKAAAAANSATARAKEIAKLTRDLADTTAATQRKALETEITELMAKVMADASDAEAQADKAEKIVARHATA